MPDVMTPPLKHFLSVQDLNRYTAEQLLDAAETRLDALQAGRERSHELAGRIVGLIFFEPSTRTRVSFERAAKALGADVIAVSTGPTSSTVKGESWTDTILNLDAMHFDIMVVRHAASGAAKWVADNTRAAVINAGDGAHEHPTQAVLDLLAMRRRLGTLEGRVLTIIGDILHSRVARSTSILAQLMGMQVRLCGPAPLLHDAFEEWGFRNFTSRREALDGADVAMALRIQHERIDNTPVPSPANYHREYGLSHEVLDAEAPGALVAHPGPANRDVEITSALLDDRTRCIALEQTEAGVAVRMAVLAALAPPAR